jgi:hypothetical protein
MDGKQPENQESSPSFNEEQFENICDKLVVPVKIGASVAVTFKLLQPLNEF